MNFSLISLILLAGLSTLACAESPSPVISERFQDDNESLEKSEGFEIEAPAIVWDGRLTGGGSCEIRVSMAEFEEDGEHHHEILLKTELMVHGHIPSDTTARFTLFRESSADGAQEYFDPSEKVDGALATIAGISVTDVKNPDFNQIQSYEDAEALNQFVKLEFFGPTVSEIEEALESSIENGNISAENGEALGNLDLVFARMKHGDHYHGATCVRLRMRPELASTVFEFEEGHEHDHDDSDGDDDHDHGDGDHGHGHDH